MFDFVFFTCYAIAAFVIGFPAFVIIVRYFRTPLRGRPPDPKVYALVPNLPGSARAVSVSTRPRLSSGAPATFQGRGARTAVGCHGYLAAAVQYRAGLALDHIMEQDQEFQEEMKKSRSMG